MLEIMLENKFNTFVLAVLYNLEEKWRGIGASSSFDDILNNRFKVNLHSAFLKLKHEDLLGEFSDIFYLNHLYMTSNLTEILSRLTFNKSVRLDGDLYQYHLDQLRTEFIMDKLLPIANIPKELVLKASKRLNELLNEQETKSLAA